jgi:PST family polysaccharide transporter
MFSKNKVLKNIVWNITTQFLNNFFPLIIMPYMIYELGGESYGEMVVALAFWGIPNLFIQYGFQVTASKKLSENKSDYSFVNNYISRIYLAKFFLFLISASLLLIVIFSTQLRYHFDMLLYTFPFIMSSLIHPNWVYIGLGRFKLQTKLILLSRVISISFLFLISLLEQKELLILAYSSMNLICSLFLWWGLIKSKYVLNFKLYMLDAFKEIKEGSEVFYASSITGGYHHLIPIFLESYFGPIYVTILNICDAARRVLYQLSLSVFQVIYQNTNSEHKDLTVDTPNTALKNTFVFVYLLYTLSFLVLMLSEPMINFFMRDVAYFDIQLVYLILLSGLSNMIMNALGLQVLIPLGYSKYLRNSFVLSVLLCFPIMLVMLGNFGVKGAIESVIICDVSVVLCLFYKHKLMNIRSLV